MEVSILFEFHLHDPLPTHTLDFIDQGRSRIQRLHVVPSTYTLAIDQNVRDRPPPRHHLEFRLQGRAKYMLIELDDMRGGDNCVFFKKDMLCLGREGAVGFGEDDYCAREY